MREFGEVRGLPQLAAPRLEADEVHGWEMTSLAAYLLGAEGLYRAPFDHLYLFMLLGNWRVVS